MIAAGIGLAASGLLHALVFGRRGSFCYERDERLESPIFLGGAAAGVGVTLAVAGGVKSVGVKRLFRQRVVEPRKVGMAGPLIAAFLITEIVLLLPTAFEAAGCISS